MDSFNSSCSSVDVSVLWDDFDHLLLENKQMEFSSILGICFIARLVIVCLLIPHAHFSLTLIRRWLFQQFSYITSLAYGILEQQSIF